jgi:hypothetical protein
MVDKQRAFGKSLQQGVSISEASRRVGINPKTGEALAGGLGNSVAGWA